MSQNSVSLHKVFKASPEKMWRAFTQPNAVSAWMPPYGYLCTVHEMNAEPGGKFRASFENFSTGHSHSFGGAYLEVRTNELLKYSDRFDDPNLPGEMITTVTFKKVMVGTELTVLQENIPAAIPVEMCYLGWQDSLDKLQRLTDPEIRDGM